MVFPVIKVKREDGEHIVGTNSHDCLYIENNAIHYLNTQCMAGTSYPEESGMYFVAKEEGWNISGRPEVEFLTLEEIIALATKNLEEQTEAKIRLNQSLKEYFEKRKQCKERLEQSSRETGFGQDTGGNLY